MAVRSRSFKDISFDLSKNIVTGDIKVLKNSEAIKNSVKNLILTKVGERLLNKYIGTNIADYLFELDTIFITTEIKDSILTVLKNFEPRIVPTDVSVRKENHELIVIISYLIVGERIRETVEFILLRES